MVYNATVQYNFNDDAAITLIGINISICGRHVDRTFLRRNHFPYYNIFNYNAYGRLVMVESQIHFGGGKKE